MFLLCINFSYNFWQVCIQTSTHFVNRHRLVHWRARGAVLACALPWLRSLLLQHASGIMSQESSLLALNSLYQVRRLLQKTFIYACLRLDKLREYEKYFPAIFLSHKCVVYLYSRSWNFLCISIIIVAWKHLGTRADDMNNPPQDFQLATHSEQYNSWHTNCYQS